MSPQSRINRRLCCCNCARSRLLVRSNPRRAFAQPLLSSGLINCWIKSSLLVSKRVIILRPLRRVRFYGFKHPSTKTSISYVRTIMYVRSEPQNKTVWTPELNDCSCHKRELCIFSQSVTSVHPVSTRTVSNTSNIVPATEWYTLNDTSCISSMMR